MKTRFTLLVLLVLCAPHRTIRSQEPVATAGDSPLKVILLGTVGGPTANAQRLGISTLVVAGSETLLFDCGRSLMTGLARLAINPADVTKVFLTHLHSDHVVGLPEIVPVSLGVSGSLDASAGVGADRHTRHGRPPAEGVRVRHPGSARCGREVSSPGHRDHRERRP